MDYSILKKMIEEGVIDFDKLLLKNYKKIGLSEIEVFLIIELNNQKKGGNNFIQPSKLIKKLTIKEEDLFKILDGLIKKKYLTIRIVKEKNKDTEDFSLDNTVIRLIDVYKEKVRNEVIKSDKTFDSIEEEIVNLLENQFQKQLKPLEVELIIKWVKEDNYTVDEIKRAILQAIKANKTSISYVDGILLKYTNNKKRPNKKQYKPEKSEALKAFFNSWEKK